jgi:hypothetical protein
MISPVRFAKIMDYGRIQENGESEDRIVGARARIPGYLGVVDVSLGVNRHNPVFQEVSIPLEGDQYSSKIGDLVCACFTVSEPGSPGFARFLRKLERRGQELNLYDSYNHSPTRLWTYLGALRQKNPVVDKLLFALRKRVLPANKRLSKAASEELLRDSVDLYQHYVNETLSQGALRPFVVSVSQQSFKKC